jgi:hypothetical protein
VLEHLNSSERLSAGLKALPDKISSFASTQAAWRFFGNESVSLSVLQEPLTAAAHEGIASHCSQYALCVHDWSHLNYKHLNKTDTYAITHETDVGYDLQTSLIVSDQNGQPLAPVAQRLVSADGSYATYGEAKPTLPVKDHLDEVSDCIAYLETQGFSKPLVHLIDREGDSVGHIRRWEAAGCFWLVRVKDNPKVEHESQALACKTIAQTLIFEKTRQVIYHGKQYWQWVAETPVRLTRPARPSQKKVKKPPVPGEPVEARLVVSRILSEDGEVLAEWLLMCNIMDMDASTLALWYYWRWQIECFFKLLKSAGHHLESWQQESAQAIAKRLLVASMACATVWAIAADNSKEAAELRAFLVKLSGRQMRHKKEFTNPALLAGLWVFLSMLEIMGSYSQEELDSLKATAQQFLEKVV